MRKPTIVLVRGACGAGKSTWVGEHIKDGDQHIDFAKYLEAHWYDRPYLAIQAIDPNAGTVYIEAIFGPGSPSYLNMRSILERQGYPVSQIIIHRPLPEILTALARDNADGKRIDLAIQYWRQFEESGMTKNILKPIDIRATVRETV